MKYCEGGTLEKRVAEEKCGLRLDLVRRYAAEILDALAYIHSVRILHRDLSPDNVLLTRENHCKLSDFGLSTWTDGVTEVGKRGYMAPELLSHGSLTGEVHGAPADIYSFGIVVLFMFGGSLDEWSSWTTSQSSPGAGQTAPVKLCFNTEHPPAALEALVKRTAADDPTHRLSAEQLRGDDFFETVD